MRLGVPPPEVDRGASVRDLKRRQALGVGLASAATWALGGLGTALAHGPLRISGTGSGIGGLTRVAAIFEKRPPGHAVNVLPAYGSSGGIAALLDRQLEVAVSNRPPSPQEIARAAIAPAPAAPGGRGTPAVRATPAATGASLEASGAALRFVEYARTPLVIAVHRRLGVSELSSDQLARLYADGPAAYPNGQRARPVLRDPQDIDSRLIGSIAPAARAAHESALARKGMLRAVTDTEAAELAEQVPGAFAATTLAQILSEGRNLVPLRIDGREPTVEALAAGLYPYFKPLFVIWRADAHQDVGHFVDFLLSPEGQAILVAHGHLARSRFAP